MEILNLFNTLTLKQIFWKTKTFLRKLEQSFLVESTKIENASFPHKTAISETYIKTNRMVSRKWTYHKGESFPSNYLIFLKICFSWRTSYEELIWCTNDPNAHIFVLFVSAGVLIDDAFSMWVSLTIFANSSILDVYLGSERASGLGVGEVRKNYFAGVGTFIWWPQKL